MEDRRAEDRKNGRGTGLRGMLAAIVAAVSLSACAMPFPEMSGAGKPTPKRVETGFVAAGPDSYDSADTAILVGRDKEAGTVTLLNLEVGRSYTLSMDGTTKLYDKYGDAISVDQMEKGDIVDVTFLKSKKHLTAMRLSEHSWTYSGVGRYEMNPVRGDVTIGEETYKLTSNTQYLSEGRHVELMDLNAADVLGFQGIGNQILSVRVEKGHGYLRLANDEKFIGGWIEIGQSVIQRITEDMLLLVPEGSYQVSVSHQGGGGQKNVHIGRNEETVLDIGDLVVPEPQTGTILFSVSPSGAQLFVDGAGVDASIPQELEYGLHQLIARAEGYHSITRYIRVAQETLAFDLTLEPAEAGASEGAEDSSADAELGETPADTTTDYYKVYVDAPAGAEAYLDGRYVGIVPCSFKKVEGSHVLILRMKGYETRSYTVQVDGEEKDISYSFAELAKYASDSQSDTPTVSPSATPGPTPTAAPKQSPSAAPKATPTAAPKATPTAAPKATPTAAPKTTPTAAPVSAPSATPGPTPTATPGPTPTATPEPTPTATPEPTPSPDSEQPSLGAPEPSPTATPGSAPSADSEQPSLEAPEPPPPGAPGPSL